jgi:hypothetical protein
MKIKIINNNKDAWYYSKIFLQRVYDTVECPHLITEEPDCYYIKDRDGSYWSISKKDVEIVSEEEIIENKILIVI